MNKQETIEDIIAEMRGLVKPSESLNHTYELLNGLADRLEAAWKREKAAIEADALAVGGLVEASRSTAENSSAVGDAAHKRELSKIASKNGVDFGQLGDAAKLREALVQCELFLGYVSRHGHPTLNPGDKCTACSDADELRGMVVRALAAPPRNCERFQTWDEAKDAYWREQGDPCDWRKLGAWFFALEGGAK